MAPTSISAMKKKPLNGQIPAVRSWIQSLGEVTSGGDALLMLPTDFWDDSSERNATKCLLFEGSGEGQGDSF